MTTKDAGPIVGFDMDSPSPLPVPRRQVISSLGLVLAGFVLAACASQPAPSPAKGSWQEDYYRRKQKYREWGQGAK